MLAGDHRGRVMARVTGLCRTFCDTARRQTTSVSARVVGERAYVTVPTARELTLGGSESLSVPEEVPWLVTWRAYAQCVGLRSPGGHLFGAISFTFVLKIKRNADLTTYIT